MAFLPEEIPTTSIGDADAPVRANFQNHFGNEKSGDYE
jgi:hypothetical protein